MKHTTCVIVAVFGVGMACASVAGPIYKWTDAQGHVHFGDAPKDGAGGSEVKLKGTGPSPQAEQAIQKLAEDRAARAKDAAERKVKEDKAAQQQAAKDAERARYEPECARARDRLAHIEEFPRLMEIGADGEGRRLTDEERQQRIDEVRKFLAEHCQ